MNVQEVARCVMRETKTTQADIAEKGGLAGQSSVGTFLRSKSMRVDNLLLILNACGYELVARSGDGTHPEYVIGENMSVKRPEGDEGRLAEMIRKAVEEELAKRDRIVTF